MVIWKHATLFSAQEFGCETTSAEKREIVKMKKMIISLMLVMWVFVGYAVEVGDVECYTNELEYPQFFFPKKRLTPDFIG